MKANMFDVVNEAKSGKMNHFSKVPTCPQVQSSLEHSMKLLLIIQTVIYRTFWMADIMDHTITPDSLLDHVHLQNVHLLSNIKIQKTLFESLSISQGTDCGDEATSRAHCMRNSMAPPVSNMVTRHNTQSPWEPHHLWMHCGNNGNHTKAHNVSA